MRLSLAQGIDWGLWLAFQGNDIVTDEGACTLSWEAQGEAFAIRGFKRDMRLKLWLVLFGDIDDPPELVCYPVCLEGTSWLCHDVGGCTQHDREQEDPAWFHTGSFLKAVIPCTRSMGSIPCFGGRFLAHTSCFA